jgi:hypothetical protein
MIKRFLVVTLVSLTPMVSALADNNPHAAAGDAVAQGHAAMADANSQLGEANKQAEAAMADAKKQMDAAMGRIDNAKAATEAKKTKVIGDSKAAVNAGTAQVGAAAAQAH